MSRYLIWVGFLFVTQAWAASYFQQEVAYDMDARLNPFDHTITVDEGMMYVNNAPDTLNTLYFHLYMNRYQKGAFLSENARRTESTGGINIHKVYINGVAAESYDIDQTLMRVPLEEPMLPGDTLYMRFDFTVQLPPAAGRYGYNGDHHDVGNWFVTPVVYDRNGWHLHQHIDNEFYQEWGRFDVRITVPKGFVTGATGVLQNPDSALADTTAAVRNWFVEHPDDSTHFTTWHYKAENVHDFAWTTDPDYRYYTETVNGVAVHYLVMKENYKDWIKYIRAGTGAVEWLEKLVGPYPYKQITVADTYIRAGGMEYPQIVFINTFLGPRFSVSYFRAVVIHEIAHNWFYGLLASNQTEDEWMDEGFTQFMEIEIMERLYGVKGNMNGNRHGTSWLNFSHRDQDDRGGAMRNYLYAVLSGREVDPVATMPDHFRSGVTVASYDKTALILGMLENVLSPRVFWRAMRAYYRQWRFRHPRPEDMIRAFERASGRRLKWFFDQWIASTRNYDVAVEEVSGRCAGDSCHTRIVLENKRDIYMPVDMLCVLENGDSLLYRIPIDSFGTRLPDRRYLPYWYFTDKQYRTEIITPSPVREVVLDPGHRLADVNRLNNSNGLFPRQEFNFMNRSHSYPPLDAYAWDIFPTLDYNATDGVKPGLRFDGAYLGMKHMMGGAIYFPLKKQAPDGYLRYENSLPTVSRRLSWSTQLTQMDGLRMVRAGLKWRDGVAYMARLQAEWYRSYKKLPDNGAPYQQDVTRLGLEWVGSARGKGRWMIRAEASGYGSAYRFLRFEWTQHKEWQAGYGDYALILNSRLGLTRGALPDWEQFLLYGANGRQRFNNPWYRAADLSSGSWNDPPRLYMKKGAVVRGSQLTGVAPALSGNNTVQVSVDILFPSVLANIPLPVLSSIENRLFADAGLVWDRSPDADNMIYSAGFALHYRPPYAWAATLGLENIVAEFPLFVTHTGYRQQAMGFRWLLSLEWNLWRTPFWDALEK